MSTSPDSGMHDFVARRGELVLRAHGRFEQGVNLLALGLHALDGAAELGELAAADFGVDREHDAGDGLSSPAFSRRAMVLRRSMPRSPNSDISPGLSGRAPSMTMWARRTFLSERLESASASVGGFFVARGVGFAVGLRFVLVASASSSFASSFLESSSDLASSSLAVEAASSLGA